MTAMFEMMHLKRADPMGQFAFDASIAAHRNAAIAADASDAEFAEPVFVATALRAGAALTHGTHLFPG